MAMLRERVASNSDVPVRYLSSARTYEDVLYRGELDHLSTKEGIEIVHTLTRSHPDFWSGPTRRVDRVMLEEHVWPVGEQPFCFVCGPTGFVETVATTLTEIGHQPDRIKTERFGPSGG
jgi:ferredoxin-NADP reductase